MKENIALQVVDPTRPLSPALLQKHTELSSMILKGNGDPVAVALLPPPESVAIAINAPKLIEIKSTWGSDNIGKCLITMTTAAAKFLNFDEDQAQIAFVAVDFADMYKVWSIEDFMLFFQKVRRREFGKTYHKNDYQVFYLWAQQYDANRDMDLGVVNFQEGREKQAEEDVKLLEAPKGKAFHEMPEEFQKAWKKTLGYEDVETKHGREQKFQEYREKAKYKASVRCLCCGSTYPVERFSAGKDPAKISLVSNFCPSEGCYEKAFPESGQAMDYREWDENEKISLSKVW